MVAVSAASCGLKLRAMPQKYQIEVSVSGVMKSTTMLEALCSAGGVVAALAGMRHADFDHHVAGRREAADLPAVHRHVVGQAVAAQGRLPERRRA